MIDCFVKSLNLFTDDCMGFCYNSYYFNILFVHMPILTCEMCGKALSKVCESAPLPKMHPTEFMLKNTLTVHDCL